MAKLCDNSGHPLPNAVGVGLYCNHCGEPVKPPVKPPVKKRA